MDVCPTCRRQNSCPTCGAQGDFLTGASRAERWHWYRRAIWALHKLRLSFRGISRSLGDEMSDIIHRTERAEELANEMDEDPTDPL